MNILALDGSAVAASACVLRDDTVISEVYGNTGLTHSQTLMDMTDAALRYARCSFSEIDRLAVSWGPGSFTGVRIAVATVKGLSKAQDTPCVGVSTLEAAAYNLLGSERIVCSVMDARCHQVYTACFRPEGERIQRISPDEAISIELLGGQLKKYGRPVVLVGDGARLCYNELVGVVPDLALANPAVRFQRASGVALCAREKLPIPGNDLMPFYLRLPQAERNLKEKNRRGE